MFCLSGNSSVLSSDIFPAIELDGEDFELGFVNLCTYNTIPNVETNRNNKFHYVHNDKNETIVLPEGTYEISDINKYIQNNLKEGVTIQIQANNNTLKVEINTNVAIDFSSEKSIGRLLGFKSKVLEANKTHESDCEVNILKVNVIRIECNIVRGSYHNGRETHIIHEFFPLVAAGFKIVNHATPILYLPVSTQRINNITVTLRDQNNELINFRGETISLRLHLRKRLSNN